MKIKLKIRKRKSFPNNKAIIASARLLAVIIFWTVLPSHQISYNTLLPPYRFVFFLLYRLFYMSCVA